MAKALADLATYFSGHADRRARPTRTRVDDRQRYDRRRAGRRPADHQLRDRRRPPGDVQPLAGGLEALIRHLTSSASCGNPRLIDNAVDEIIRCDAGVALMCCAREARPRRYAHPRRRACSSRIYPRTTREVFEQFLRHPPQNANDHLAFGIGVHFCLGAHLARMELRAFLRELLQAGVDRADGGADMRRRRSSVAEARADSVSVAALPVDGVGVPRGGPPADGALPVGTPGPAPSERRQEFREAARGPGKPLDYMMPVRSPIERARPAGCAG
jgi:hypothetical protein